MPSFSVHFLDTDSQNRVENVDAASPDEARKLIQAKHPTPIIKKIKVLRGERDGR